MKLCGIQIKYILRSTNTYTIYSQQFCKFLINFTQHLKSIHYFHRLRLQSIMIS